MTTRFYIIRHGETEWNTVKRLQGSLDSPLTQAGIAQANQAAELLIEYRLNGLVSSPVGRALNTAKIIAKRLNLNLEADERLKERHFGDWQGRYFETLRDEPHFQPIFEQLTNHRPPNGESAVECVSRVKHCLIELAEKYANNALAVVTHGDVIRTLLLDLGQAAKIDAYSRVGNGSVFCLSFDPVSDRFTVLPTD